MKSRAKRIYIIRGIGIGFIIASILFLALKSYIVEDQRNYMSNDEIVERAKELGMVTMEESMERQFSDDEIMERAKELGMVHKNKPKDMEDKDAEKKTEDMIIEE